MYIKGTETQNTGGRELVKVFSQETNLHFKNSFW